LLEHGPDFSLDPVIDGGVENDHAAQQVRASGREIRANRALNVPRPFAADRANPTRFLGVIWPPGIMLRFRMIRREKTRSLPTTMVSMIWPSRAKIRNLMSVLFNHARRHDFIERNPITLVRQSAKRRTIPEVLLPSEINRLAYSLRNREKTLVLLAAGTGLRMSELFGLKWQDVDFAGKQVSVLRSIVKQSVGPCKTEASQKPVPLDPRLVRTLRAWRRTARFRQPTDWVFASSVRQGKFPFWGQALLRHYIRPAAVKVGITKRIGWHTFRHSYSTLLKASGADIKVMQELLRHASTRVTLDTYTQAVTPAKRAAQTAVVTQFFPIVKTA
jgi:integrase